MLPIVVNVNLDGDLICRMGSKLIEGCRSIKDVSQRYRRDSNVKSILRALASTESASITLKSIEIEGVPWPLLRAAAVRGELTDTLIEASLDSEAAWKIRDEQFCSKSEFALGSLRDIVDRLRNGSAYADIGLLSVKICSAEFDEICEIDMRPMAKRMLQSEPDLFVGNMSLLKAIGAKARNWGDEDVGVLCEGVPIFVGGVFGSPGIVRWHPQSGSVFSYKDRRAKLEWRTDSNWDKVTAKLSAGDTNTDLQVTRAIFNRLETTSPKVISTSEEIDILYLITEVLEHRDIYAEDHDAISNAIFDQLTLVSRFMAKAREVTGSEWMSLDMADRRRAQKCGKLSTEATEKVETRPDKVVELIQETLQDTSLMSGLSWDMAIFNSSGARNATEVLNMHSRYLEKCKQNTDMREKQRGMHLSVLAARRMYHSDFGQEEGYVHLTYGLEKTVSGRYPTKTEFKDVSVLYSPGSESAYVYILGEDVLSELDDTKRQPLAGTNLSMLACARLLLSMATQRPNSKELVLNVERYLAGSLSTIFTVHDFLVRKMFSQVGEVFKLSDIQGEAIRLFEDRRKAHWATVEVLSMLASMGVVDSAQTVGKSCLYDCLGSIFGGIVADIAKINLNTTPDLCFAEVRQIDGKTYIALDTDKRRALIISGVDPDLNEDEARKKIYHLTLGARPNEENGIAKTQFVSLRVGRPL